MLGLTIPEEYGGAGLDFRYEAALIDEMYHRGVDAFGAPLHNAIRLMSDTMRQARPCLLRLS